MDVRKMGVNMSQRLVPVAMFMLYLKTNRNIVGVSMVRIVDMLMQHPNLDIQWGERRRWLARCWTRPFSVSSILRDVAIVGLLSHSNT